MRNVSGRSKPTRLEHLTGIHRLGASMKVILF
jgi:hypothetical protein